MQEEIINYLICPHQEKNRTCQAGLVLDEVFDCSKSNGLNEINEGYLKCKGCGSRFPIFLGIPVLLANMTNFLRWNIPHLMVLSQKYNRINRKMIADAIFLLLEEIPKKERPYLFYITPKVSLKMIKGARDGYFVNNYDSLLKLIGENHPLYGPIMKYYPLSLDSVLNAFLKSYLGINNNAVMEVGCHVGGFLRSLSPYSKFVFGLDTSFLQLFYASCILKHFPCRMKDYSLNILGNIVKKRRIRSEEFKNVTLIAGEAENIPIRESCLSALVSSNVFDIIEDPIASIEEAGRVLSKDGLFLFSSCYGGLSAQTWKKMGIKRNQTVWGKVKEVIENRMKILETCDNIPWLVRNNERSISIFNNYCFCARKTE